MKYSKPSTEFYRCAGKHIYVSCISCGNQTKEADRICGKCDSLFPEYLPAEQYDNYFKLLGKKNNDNT